MDCDRLQRMPVAMLLPGCYNWAMLTNPSHTVIATMNYPQIRVVLDAGTPATSGICEG